MNSFPGTCSLLFVLVGGQNGYIIPGKITNIRQALVVHACNPNYSRGRDQEDPGSKPAQANSSRDPISEKSFTQKGWWSGSR
jgi:hypothetical protein